MSKEIVDTVLNLKEMNKVYASELNLEDPENGIEIIRSNECEKDKPGTVGSDRKSD